MKISLASDELIRYTSAQLNNIFPDNKLVNLNQYKSDFELTIDRLDYCFRHCAFKNYFENSETKFNHLYADQYLMYLWYLSNTIWKESSDEMLSNKIYYLNKVLHGFDCMYDAIMPNIFLVFHGVGTVLGKASYSDYLTVAHGVTVGNHKGVYPVLGKGVGLTAHSSVIGNCKIGDRVSVSVYTSIFEKDIPSDSVVFNNNSSVMYKAAKNPHAQKVYNVDFSEL